MVNYVTSGKLVSLDNFVHPDRVIDSYLILFGIRNVLYIREDEDKYCLEKNTSLILTPNKRQSSFKPSKDISYYWCHFYFNNQVTIVNHDDAMQLYHMMSKDVLAEKDKIILIPKTYLS